MSISDKGMAKTGFVYLLVSIFCALFGAVYESFSHEVYSYFMLYAFMFPLVGGVLPFFGLAFGKFPLSDRISRNLYHSGVATLTVGSLFKGVLEIYGTTNGLVLAYWIIGGIFCLSGLFCYGNGRKKGVKHTCES